MILSSAVIKGIVKHLHDYEQEILHMLLDGGLSVKKVAARITTVYLTSRQVGYKMRSLARRTLVTHVPSPAGAYWCLTEEGRQIASFVKFAKAKSRLWKMPPPGRPMD